MPLAGTISQPEINTNDCTGCGACVAPCPGQAIEVCT
jgi:ferredoxin-type protein NapF